MRYLFGSVLLVISFVGSMLAQSLPAGKWQLQEYKFANKTERPLKGVNITLVVHEDGKLGGSSGCNAYGGSYASDDGKLRVTDIISTMMACEEPTPQFEHAFFTTLESATSAESKDGVLVIKAKDGHYLRFVSGDKKSN